MLGHEDTEETRHLKIATNWRRFRFHLDHPLLLATVGAGLCFAATVPVLFWQLVHLLAWLTMVGLVGLVLTLASMGVAGLLCWLLVDRGDGDNSRFQFSLRSLLVVTTISAVLLSVASIVGFRFFYLPTVCLAVILGSIAITVVLEQTIGPKPPESDGDFR